MISRFFIFFLLFSVLFWAAHFTWKKKYIKEFLILTAKRLIIPIRWFARKIHACNKILHKNCRDEGNCKYFLDFFLLFNLLQMMQWQHNDDWIMVSNFNIIHSWLHCNHILNILTVNCMSNNKTKNSILRQHLRSTKAHLSFVESGQNSFLLNSSLFDKLSLNFTRIRCICLIRWAYVIHVFS